MSGWIDKASWVVPTIGVRRPCVRIDYILDQRIRTDEPAKSRTVIPGVQIQKFRQGVWRTAGKADGLGACTARPFNQRTIRIVAELIDHRTTSIGNSNKAAKVVSVQEDNCRTD